MAPQSSAIGMPAFPPTREVLQLEVANQRLVGTMHLPGQPRGSAIGVVLLSFGQQPRAWVGDLGCCIADSLAHSGVTVFRFDMPGTGDSPGDLPLHLEEFWRHIQEGGHEAIAKELLLDLQRRYSLKGIVLGGFCGGAVTAVHASDISSANLLGLILIEPEVGLTPVANASQATSQYGINSVSSLVDQMENAKRKLLSPRSWVRFLSGRSSFGFWWELLRNGVADLTRRRLKKVLPPDSNFKFIKGWHSFMSSFRKRPVLVVTVGSAARRKYYESYGFRPGVSDPNKRLEWHEIPYTTHAMLAGGAKEKLTQTVTAWISSNFSSV